SYISPQRDKTQSERQSSAGSVVPILLPTPFPFATYGHTLHDLMYFSQEDELSGYEQQVY
ncbi:MAG: hypothetical protein ACJ795_13795, partial [Ktedonobacteraceae bacterium]